MDPKTVVAIVVAVVPVAVYIFAMRRFGHADWRGIAHPFQKHQAADLPAE
ncbi:MAG TPA: hypothetical protein VFL51_13680 [Pseudolabrys sp.]|nr:hypothetical protein [Pseudolabrys sp.]